MGLKDKIDFKISTGHKGLSVKVRYESEVEAAGMNNKTATEYEVMYASIVEYRKDSSDSTDTAYDWGNDTIVQKLLLETWESFSEVTEIADGDVSQFSVSSPDGYASFNFTVSRANEDENMSANKMKIDFSLVDFPWVSDDTYVAVLTSVESKQMLDVKYHDKEPMELADHPGPKKPKDVAITFDEAQDTVGVIPFGEYTWEVTAEATMGEEASTPTAISVVATSPTDPTSLDPPPKPAQQWIAFSFVGDTAMAWSSIYWDPETGVAYSENASEDSGAGPVGQSSSLFSLGTCLVSSMLFLAAF